MASVSSSKDGKRRVQFTNWNGKRGTIHLGAVSLKDARTVASRVEELIVATKYSTVLKDATAEWVNALPQSAHDKLVRYGLAAARAERVVVTLRELLTEFFAGVDVKPATLTRMKQAESALIRHFGESKDVATIQESDAEEWRTALRDEGYAVATTSRTVRYARQIFRWAVRRGKAEANPFEGLKAGPQTNAARRVFIDRETIAKVIEAAPDAEWRLLIALSRFGGLRVPSEALELRWSDVDWAQNRLTVRSPKTEHHEGGAERIIPIFAEVRMPLMDVYELAEEGSETVFTRYRSGSNLNPQLRRIITRAGIKPWPKAWHNLRASRQTELAATFPLHTVCAWIGNTKAIAAGHYLQVTDADWARATRGDGGDAESDARLTQIATPQPTAPVCASPHESSQSEWESDIARSSAREGDEAQSESMGRGGLEPPTPAFSVQCSTN